MSSNYKSIENEIKSWNFGLVHQDPMALAEILGKFVAKGSCLHLLNTSELVVYANIKENFPGKEEVTELDKNGKMVAKTVKGLMAAGAKFFDAIFYISLKENERPPAAEHNYIQGSKAEKLFPVYNDTSKLVKYIFALYFFILIRAHPPTETGDYKNQPMPKFINTVLAMKESTSEISDYLAEFELSKIKPTWVQSVDIKGLSQEATSRMGLGVAGYRLPTIFNLINPDKYNDINKDDKPKWLDDSIIVAKSFRSAGFCWDFHPATRDPNLLAKYGNINKNITNLIIESYSEKTIKLMVDTKKLAKSPVFDPAYTNYQTWDKSMIYEAKKKIFA